MHTLKLFSAALAPGVCLLLGPGLAAQRRWWSPLQSSIFIVLWLAATLVNMWVGVSKAGYSIKDEAPVALLVFAVPAFTSILIWWRNLLPEPQCLGH